MYNSRAKTTRISFLCHSKAVFAMFAIVIILHMCLSVTFSDAKPNPIPEPKANPDALWDKLPALQKFHAAGKLLSLNPIQSFISPTQGSVNIYYNK